MYIPNLNVVKARVDRDSSMYSICYVYDRTNDIHTKPMFSDIHFVKIALKDRFLDFFWSKILTKLKAYLK